MEHLLQKIKVSLRISHAALDEDIADTIDAALADLETCGVVVPQGDDPLVLNAVKLYCKAAYTDDTGKAAAYMERYNALKACLMMAGDYREAVVVDE
jgi:hypothetical protein